MLRNASFESLDWLNIVVPPSRQNQEPEDWELTWLEDGEVLYDSGNPDDESDGPPEAVHKGWFPDCGWTLPQEQWPDGPDALVLDGWRCYKVFSSGQRFGAQLRQVIKGLEPGTQVVIDMPVRVHRYPEKDKDPYGAEVGLWVNGYGFWEQPPDREWYIMSVQGFADMNGDCEVLIKVKSKWKLPKDFFFDNLGCTCIPATEPPPPPEEVHTVGTHKILIYSNGESEHVYEKED